MRNVFRATRMGCNREQDIVWFDTDSIQKNKQAWNLSRFKTQRRKDIHILGMSMMVSNIMILYISENFRTIRCPKILMIVLMR